MVFAIEEMIEKQDIAALARAIQLRGHKAKKWVRITSKVLCFIMFLEFLIIGLLGLFGLVYNILHKMPNPLYPEILAIILGFLLSFLLPFAWCTPLTTWIAWKNCKGKGMTLTYRFGEEDFSAHTSVSDERCDFVVIEEVVEDKLHYFLFINKSAAYLLRKDSFTEGDPEQFRGFIAEKIGKPIKQI